MTAVGLGGLAGLAAVVVVRQRELDRTSSGDGRPLLLPTIMCQCHGSHFDVTSGAEVDGPATRPLGVYEVQEVEGSIQVGA